MEKKTTKTAEQKKKKDVIQNKKSHVEEKDKVKAEDNKTVNIEIEEDKTEDKSAHKKKKTRSSADLSKKLDEAEKKAAEWHDKYLRLSAEFDNYRKRTLKEKADLLKSAGEDVLKDMLPVIDDFERGMDNIDKSEDIDALRKGVHLIYSKFVEFLKQKGIKEIEAREKEFDLDFHEAVTKFPTPDENMKGKVVDVVEKGYLLNEKVIRYAKVVVGE
ncbi:MAG: nucleotide exchange factor GrpE [Bacteroidales bacterium]|nr:nucleotide exchange factor GrpE [Bacteroidales bacterium]